MQQKNMLVGLKNTKKTYDARYSLAVLKPTTAPAAEYQRSCHVVPAFSDDAVIKFVMLGELSRWIPDTYRRSIDSDRTHEFRTS